MTDSIEKLAEVIGKEIVGRTAASGSRLAADAVLAALPGLVKPLEWENTLSGEVSQGRLHWFKVYENSKGTYTLDDGEAVQDFDTPEAAKDAATEIHRAQIMQAFGVDALIAMEGAEDDT